MVGHVCGARFPTRSAKSHFNSIFIKVLSAWHVQHGRLRKGHDAAASGRELRRWFQYSDGELPAGLVTKLRSVEYVPVGYVENPRGGEGQDAGGQRRRTHHLDIVDLRPELDGLPGGKWARRCIEGAGESACMQQSRWCFAETQTRRYMSVSLRSLSHRMIIEEMVGSPNPHCHVFDFTLEPYSLLC